MRYRLRTLLIVLALGPPVLAGGWWALPSDVLWLTVVVALAVGWWLEHRTSMSNAALAKSNRALADFYQEAIESSGYEAHGTRFGPMLIRRTEDSPATDNRP